ncbi:MAG: hypothetical protein Q4G05_01325 [Clostridia bacterium]|nr:hypothetical protein [Clostridia bacterium]
MEFIFLVTSISLFVIFIIYFISTTILENVKRKKYDTTLYKIFEEEGKKGVKNYYSKVICLEKCDEMFITKEGFIRYDDGDFCGVIDKYGNHIMKLICKDITICPYNLFLIHDLNGHQKLYDAYKLLLESIKDIRFLEDRLIEATFENIEKKYYITINNKGELCIITYTYIDRNLNYILVQDKDKYAIIDYNCKLLVPFIYDKIDIKHLYFERGDYFGFLQFDYICSTNLYETITGKKH